MPKLILVVAVSLATGFAVAAWLVAPPERPSTAAEPAVAGFDADAGVDKRLRALESAVSTERQARQLLEDELLALYDALEELRDAGAAVTGLPAAASARALPLDRRAGTAGNARIVNDDERRTKALIDAGFSAARADWILKRESELRMQAMQERFEAMRAGATVNPWDRLQGSGSALRDELGDAEYEMYLEANGRPVSVGVQNVLDFSPALEAGLEPGDRITHYDGERVFSTFDLTQQTLRGEPGESVVVNIVRNDAPMQVVLPRGPLGITTGRRR